MTHRSSSIALDQTHDSALRSWVSSANNHPDFPIQNLPLGVFSPNGGAPRAGVAIGKHILDLPALLAAGLLSGEAASAVEAAPGAHLNDMLSLGAGPRRSLRVRLSELLREGSADRDKLAPLLHQVTNCKLLPPTLIGDYTDFLRRHSPRYQHRQGIPPRQSRFYPTTSGCRSDITVAPPRLCSRAPQSAGQRDN